MLPSLALLLAAGFWQLDRAEQKRALIERYQAAATAPAKTLTVDAKAPEALRPQLVEARGRYLPSPQLWLDNQVSHGRPGYRLWTPLQLAQGGIVLVDRGWLPAPASRDQLPQAAVPEGPLTVRGWWREWPRAALRLDNRVCEADAERVVQYPRYEELRCLFDQPLADGLLLLSPQDPHGFRREWNVVGVGPERHLSYALQWFAFAVTLIGIFVILNFKQSP